MNSSHGMKSALQDDWLPKGTPMYAPKTQLKTQKRPHTACPGASSSRPWVNPNAPSVPVTKKFHVSLNSKQFESRVSKKAPYAPRSHSSLSTWETPKVVNGKAYLMPQYNSLEDPHLRDYFARKVGVKPKLSDRNSMKKIKPEKTKATRVVYNITIKTGNMKNAQTDARVFIQLRGTNGKLTKQHLVKKVDEEEEGSMDLDQGKFVFKPGSTEHFILRSPDIGELISVDIEHDGMGRKQSWFLQEIIIKNQKTKQLWYLPCNSWLSLYEGDCQVKRTLKPEKQCSKPERVVYQVEVVTGNKRGAGTDAHVFLTIYGDRETTRRVQLVNSNINTFERDQTDTFKIKVKHLGKISQVLVEHDNTGFAPGWFLDKIIITNTNSPKEKSYFLCNNWLSTEDGDGSISRLLKGTKSLDNVAESHKYTISTYTGDKRGAGTDANVYVTLFSKDGSTTEMKLNDSKNNFERNKVDIFTVESPNIGSLTRVRIRHDNKGVAAGWFLSKVIVKDDENNSFEFPCNRWLSESEDDGQISRDLVLADGGEDCTPGFLYNVHVTTGDVRGASTSAKVFVIFYGGENGELTSGKLWILNGKSDNFERGRTDIFTVECAEEFSPLHHITIGHNNTGPGAGWFLERVVVESVSTGIEQTFFCRKWLADDEGDRLIERDLVEDIDYRKQRESKNIWNVSLHTSDLRGAGTDANVFFVLYGDKGKSEEIKLASESNNFERGNVDNFKVDAKDIGGVYKMRIWHDDAKLYADWHLEKITIDNPATKERYLFECNRWLGRSEDDGEIIRELPVLGGKEDPLPVIPYEVSVYTGDKRGAGTDADVFVNIFGERGDTGERPLRQSKTNRNKFERNQVDEFTVEAVSLSELTAIRIGHNNKNGGAAWFLDKVIVKDPTENKSFPFLCQRWLAKDEDDGQIVRELPVGDTATLLKTTSYHVNVKTGDIRGAGTNANVYLMLFGENGDTGKLMLRDSENTKDKWERGRTDAFTLEAMDIGKVNKLIIGHDGSGMGAGWFLDSVHVDVPSQGQKLRFSCNRWLAIDEDDGLIERVLYPSEELETGKKIPYEIEVHTGDVRGAGTNSNVFIVLYGKEKKSEEHWLRNKTDNFERNQVDKFKIECEEIGPLTKLRVGHDNAGMGAAWFLDKIIVRRLQPPATPEKKKTSAKFKGEQDEENDVEDLCNYIFPCNRWLAKGEDDGQIIRELVPFDASGKIKRSNSLPSTIYVVHVFTGDLKGSGTNSNVFVNIHGENGDTGDRQLKKSETHIDKFERNQEDLFKIEAVNLGKLHKVKVAHDNSGLQSSWYLEKIEVEDTSSGTTYLFPCNRWLSKNEDDGALSRELAVVNREEYERRRTRTMSRRSMSRNSVTAGDSVELEQKAEKTSYNITVETGDVTGAGTDANVYLIIYGENGDSGNIDLKTSKTNKNKFERNQVDVFTTEAVHLGNINKIRIGHDNKGGFAGWYLDNVIIDAPSLGHRWSFPAGRWLDNGKDDGKLEVELYPATEKEETYDKYVPYEIVIYTSDISGAGTDSNIFITIYGLLGIQTGEVLLTDNKKKRKDSFNRGSVDVFVRELVDVGEQIDKIRIGHDNKGFGAAWHLDKVEIRRLTEKTESGFQGSVTFTFPCNRWFAKNEDDGAIVRELVPSTVLEEGLGRDGRVSVQEHAIDTLDVHQYKVHVFTGDIKKAGTDANVFITMYGMNGDTGERQLSKSETNRDKFERGKEDVFVLEAADLGYIRKVTVRHDNSNLGADWYLDRIEVVDETESNKRKYIFICERWLAKKKDDGKLKRTLYEKNYEGDRSSTKSSIYSSSHGDGPFGGSSPSLSRKSTATSPSLSRSSASPKVQRKASVRSSAADEVFENEVKGKLKKSPSKSSIGGVSTKSLLETIPYTVSVATGEKKEHETEASVFIVLIGIDDVSPKIPLELIGKTKFEAGSVETFSVESEDVGDVKKIELGHDGYRTKDSWYVKYVDIDVPTTGRQYSFPCECWLGKDKEDGKTARIFTGDDSKDLVYKPKVPYQMTVYTGDLKNAGTDSEIKMTLFGTDGESKEIVLDKNEERFERNAADMFRIDIDDVGKPTKLRIGHNGKGSRPQWFLEKVVLLNLNDESVSIFQCQRWLSKSEDDGKLIRELAAQVDGAKTVEETRYTISVKTGDLRSCGTDANVFMKIFGELGSSEELALKESSTNKDKFERGKTDVFEFSMLGLGKLTKIRIWHDNKYMRAGWFLSSVEILEEKENQTYLFPCERWLAKDEDDGSLVRELSCANRDVPARSKESLSATGYEVTFITSDRPNSGTINNAILVLVDEKGKKSKVKVIENSSKKKILRRGQKDTVKIASKPLSSLNSVLVGLRLKKASSEQAKWHLQELQVKDLEEDVRYIFAFNDWIYSSNSSDDFVEILCSNVEKSKVDAMRELKPIQYELRTFTADVSGAGTDANVTAIVYGEFGDTGRRELKKSQSHMDKFERGNMDNFKIEALDLGSLTKVFIEHDNSGFGAGWLLDRVEVTNSHSNQTTVFPCNKWLDKKKGDKMIARELYPVNI